MAAASGCLFCSSFGDKLKLVALLLTAQHEQLSLCSAFRRHNSVSGIKKLVKPENCSVLQYTGMPLCASEA